MSGAPTFDDRNSFYYTQFYKGTSSFIGIKLNTYGVKVTMLFERIGLIGATVMVDAAPPS